LKGLEFYEEESGCSRQRRDGERFRPPDHEGGLILLKQFEISYEVILTSRTGHRSGHQIRKRAAGRGIRIIIVAPGRRPTWRGHRFADGPAVIGVPSTPPRWEPRRAPFDSPDAGGIPWPHVVGKAGARNAALMAARILALEDRDWPGD